MPKNNLEVYFIGKIILIVITENMLLIIKIEIIINKENSE